MVSLAVCEDVSRASANGVRRRVSKRVPSVQLGKLRVDDTEVWALSA